MVTSVCARCGADFEKKYRSVKRQRCDSCMDPIADLKWRMEQYTCAEALTGCILWTASTFSTDTGTGGYGRIRWREKKEHIPATHAAWFLEHGQWPDRLLCHRCDTPRCVNVDHLFLGTYQDNSDDMIRKGRNDCPRGSAQWNSKLTEEQVVHIRHLVAEGFTHMSIAREFGVSNSLVGMIASRKIWKHVQDD